ncbi:MAG: HEAT repeat domain-containing protein, partial [Pseudobdellovibrionaceae bacterium]
LERPVAARAFAEMKVKDSSEALATVETCVRDSNEQVRKWCSQSLGKIGAPALPKILDLLSSNQSELKDAGKNALNFFDDPTAKPELEKIRAENSGWFASKKSLAIAEAINTALIKVELDNKSE